MMPKLLALLCLWQPIQGAIGKCGIFEEYVTCTPRVSDCNLNKFTIATKLEHVRTGQRPIEGLQPFQVY